MGSDHEGEDIRELGLLVLIKPPSGLIDVGARDEHLKKPKQVRAPLRAAAQQDPGTKYPLSHSSNKLQHNRRQENPFRELVSTELCTLCQSIHVWDRYDVSVAEL